jgi:dihydrolipoamide dehydrogenase
VEDLYKITMEGTHDMYDLVIIGSGPAGHTAALEAAKRKFKTVIIEKNPDMLGGVCLNEGCVPLKGLLHFSLHSKNYREIIESISGKILSLRQGLMSRLKGAGIEIISAEAKFISKDEVEAGGRTIKGRYFIISTGSAPRRFYKEALPPEKIFCLEKTPDSALIIGGGVIGCEYASFLNNLGVNVTIVEVMNSLLSGEDEEAVRALAREFKKKKITVYAKCKVEGLNGRHASFKTEEGEKEGDFDMVFEATGRVPATYGLGLDKAGVELTSKGFIKTSDCMQTSNPHIYAAGDCIDSPMLAYAASREAETAIAHISSEKHGPIDYASMPKLVFSSPQLGGIGLSEAKAAESGLNIKVYKYFFKAIGKAVVEGRETGFIKLVADTDKNILIGAAAVGEEITDIMNELSVIINNKLKTRNIIKCMHVHPSYSEIITEALKYGG